MMPSLAAQRRGTDHVERLQPAIIATVILHVLNGDSTRHTLEQSSVGGTFTVWADALHVGPVPAGVSDDELLKRRAGHSAPLLGLPEETLIARMRGWNAALERYREFEEVVFWLEHDLFDQLILLRHLDWLSGIEAGATRFTLICIGAFPGVVRFTGLGALSAAQLATLPPARTTITPRQIALGREGWALFREPDPRPLVDWIQGNLSPLPFVPGALHRHCEDYPSTLDGLSRSERQMLTTLREGEQTFIELFIACQHREERVYMGDTTFWSILTDLARGRNPLVTVVDPESGQNTVASRVALTDLGEVVLGGGADHVELNGIDRWMGGVHLTPATVWRWDAHAGTVIRDER
jgi:hypothetical protein